MGAEIKDEIEIQPGETFGFDLSVGDGETILILKRMKDGSITVPLLSHHEPSMSDRDLKTLAARMCRQAEVGLRGAS